MKVHNDLEELLAEFSLNLHRWKQDERDRRTYDEFVRYFLSDNSLALGKPEPLAKNKAFENHCEHYEFGRQEKPCEIQCDSCKWFEDSLQ